MSSSDNPSGNPPSGSGPSGRSARPAWLKVRVPLGTTYSELRRIMDEQRLNTVCEDARCPNMAECWNRGTATFMILGSICTRSCTFCAVATGRPDPPDPDEPRRVAEAVQRMRLRHAVITSVNRDDMPDGGSAMFAAVIRAIRETVPGCGVEVLLPDFQGQRDQVRTVLDARPDVFNHNVETVPRLYRSVRPQARYQRSLDVLAQATETGSTVKTGLMVGLGERFDEVVDVMRDLRAVGVQVLTIGQYLQPSKAHHPVERYVPPEEFDEWKRIGLQQGFSHVEAGPLVRSSYHAEDVAASVDPPAA